MPSRQERRKAERDAAKRAPATAAARGGEGAAAARADVNPLGHWTTQAEDPYVGSTEIAAPARHLFPFTHRRNVALDYVFY
jgi:hypothetical protein